MNARSATTLTLVPARGGSKSIPRKNIVPLAGKPLIAWTIEAALSSSRAGRVVVSTDDEEIAATARRYGAETPFVRPSELARDDTPSMPVVIHALGWLRDNDGYTPEVVLLLQPTSPLRTAEDIEGALDIARDRSADSVVSVTESPAHPFLAKRIGKDGELEDFVPHPPIERRQDLEPAYALNGAIYVTTVRHLLAHESFYAEPTYAYVMPRERSIDVDDPWDLHLCELILGERRGPD